MIRAISAARALIFSRHLGNCAKQDDARERRLQWPSDDMLGAADDSMSHPRISDATCGTIDCAPMPSEYNPRMRTPRPHCSCDRRILRSRGHKPSAPMQHIALAGTFPVSRRCAMGIRRTEPLRISRQKYSVREGESDHGNTPDGRAECGDQETAGHGFTIPALRRSTRNGSDHCGEQICKCGRSRAGGAHRDSGGNRPGWRSFRGFRARPRTRS